VRLDVRAAVPVVKEQRMNYRITCYSSSEVLDTLEMHVLAHAYHAAWRSMYERNPVGRHIIAPLDTMIVFYPAAET
jgi:hypothetical protein